MFNTGMTSEQLEQLTRELGTLLDSKNLSPEKRIVALLWAGISDAETCGLTAQHVIKAAGEVWRNRKR